MNFLFFNISSLLQNKKKFVKFYFTWRFFSFSDKIN